MNIDAKAFGGRVVCLGASAGGLEALERFFGACPPDTGAAYVVIQHLSPDHKSLMSSLLARHTRMDVVMAESGMPLQANRVHLIPPGTVMSLQEEGRLHLAPKAPRELSLPIDSFLVSLAGQAGERGVAVILSGTGSDGTRGIQALAARGGLLMVQEAESAKFDGMPRSALSTGLKAHVAPPEELAALLTSLLRGDPVPDMPAPQIVVNDESGEASQLSAILRLLLEHCGIDFADYKPATVTRRIERRMQIRHVLRLSQYLNLLQSDPQELPALRREMLISVTSFFRDPEVFDTLEAEVVEPLVSESAERDQIRVWCAGVASGEEAYSVAMLFLEAFERHQRWPQLKIFATDVDQGCIDTASAGFYQESAAAELSVERLERFFNRREGGLQVKNELRQCVVFARHNLLSDPPFTRMNLVVCRNTLIYFRAGAQDRALQSLQYALGDGGVLMLGASESLSERDECMQAVSSKLKLFRRQRAAGFGVTERQRPLRLSPQASATRLAPPQPRVRQAQGLADAGMAALLARYTPPALILNRQHEILHIFGDPSPFMLQREGSASLALNRNLPDALVAVASALLYKVERENCQLSSSPVSLMTRRGQEAVLMLTAMPLPGEGGDPDGALTLLCFEQAPQGPALDAQEPLDVASETRARMQQLEQELAATRESLQTTIEALETSNEELQSTNEELMASNEELQSSNEELQSLNEELGTVNSEYQEKLHELNCINADLDSMTKVTGLATIFLDDTLQITRFSPDAAQIFRLKGSDLARQLDDINHSLDYPDLVRDIEETLSLRRLKEREVWTRDGQRAFLTRILPYAIASSPRYGAVITFIDITAFQDVRRLQALLDGLPEHISVLDRTGRILLVNAAWRRFAAANGDAEMRQSAPGVNYLEICRRAAERGDKLAQAALNGIRCVLEGSESRFSMEYPCHSPVEKRWFVLNVAPIQHEDMAVVVSHVNISAWRSGKKKSEADEEQT